MTLITVEVRPGVFVRLTEDEAKRTGRVPAPVNAGTKKRAPRSAKKVAEVNNDDSTSNN